MTAQASAAPTDSRLLLLQELTARKYRNSSYSLRAFARDLGVSAAALSQYMSRKRELSPKNRRAISARLRLSPLEQKAFEISPRRLSREAVAHEALNEDQFRLIGDWLSFAVLSLARIGNAKGDSKSVAKTFGVTLDEARETTERLLRLKLIRLDDGKLKRTARPLTTTSDVPSEAIQRFHLGLLRKAERALLDLPVSERDITSITMPTDPAKLAEAKKLLKKTAHRISLLLASDKATEVHVLSMQLFPLTRLQAPSTSSTRNS